MPKVSVIIPVYNVEPYLRESLDSAINQTLEDIEIICVDDCSTDGSLAVLEEYAARDERIIILKHEVNQGQGVARNRGLDVATGDYIMFLDPDDWYELDACESAYNKIAKNGNDLVFFNLSFFNEEDKTCTQDDKRLNKFAPDFDNPQIKFSELSYNFLGYGECFYKIYSRDFLNNNNIRFTDCRFAEDLIFYANIIICAKSASILNKSLYNYRQHISNTVNRPLYKLLLEAHKKTFAVYCNSEFSDKYSKFYVISYVKSLLAYFKKWCAVDKTIEKDFYNGIRKVFLFIDKNYMDYKLEQNLGGTARVCYDKILKYNYFFYKLQECYIKPFLRNIFSVKNKTTHKVITVAGIKIKIRRKEANAKS